MGALRVIILISYVCFVSCQVISRDVEILDQGIVRGYNSDIVDVFSYYGILYASTPRGEDRFKAPLDPPSWTGVFEATARDIVCPQGEPFVDTFQVLNRTMDCLIVNVFAPDTNETNLPVMVYIHGGGFTEGYGQSLSPVQLASKGVVSVTMNYRLGVHGFLCLGTEFAPGNAGMKDQTAAMRWVQKNIAQFRGDPNNVLLAGSSAGGMAVEFHMLSQMSNGLFVKVAAESGSALSSAIVNLQPLATAEAYANMNGVQTGQNVQQLEQFYRSLTDDQLNDGFAPSGTDVGFVVCIETPNLVGDDTFLGELPIDIIRRGTFERRPFLSGFTTMEGIGYIGLYDMLSPLMENNFALLLPTDLTFESDNDREDTAQRVKDFYFPNGEITYGGFVDFFTDTVFAYPQLVSARELTESSVEVFLYLWSFNGSVNLPDVYDSPVWGPGHVAQTLYLLEFDNTAIYNNMTAEDLLLRERIQEVYVNFARYSDPIPSQTQLLNSAWPPVTVDALNYLNFDVTLSLGESPLRERLVFWDQVYTGSASRTNAALVTLLGAISLLLFNY